MKDFSIDYKHEQLVRENIELKNELTNALNKIHEYGDMIKELEDYIRFYQIRVNGMSDAEFKEELKDIHDETWLGKLGLRNR
ncbi:MULTISPECIES: hypothetical protein [Clostridium]|uniref:hypothetical protein n=1 Tax=Clostridium TaxID=1485 RepID=UPI0018AB36CF|nr:MULTISPECIES: hypothetical protein [Clostridium]MDU1069911.1 hypothetical protein [Clostridium sp.]MDU2677784.1 hypothetical protein [Clostridium sp.]MDU4213810.1 hypothetical protein [Clostridium sp.]MDU5173770.1 hypothetical protein [Clostridium sp.]MDU7120683.1 hypothetical protein [Clostridium sp.]